MKRKRRKRTASVAVFAILLAILITIVFARCNGASVSEGSEQQTEYIEQQPVEVVQQEPEEAVSDVPDSRQDVPEITQEPVLDAVPDVDTNEEAEPEISIYDMPARVARYGNIDMSETERAELAAIVYLEAGNQCFEGQQAVVEVVLNRVLHSAFPDTVSEVLHQGENTDVPQFSTIKCLASAEVSEEQYEAIDAALYGDTILPIDVVFFSRGGENDRVWGKIEDHVFCYEYIWR